jgi:hypothetical protein
MKTTASRIVIVLIAGMALFTAIAGADVTVSITISGTVDELTPILQHLKDMGVGVGKGAAAPGDAIKMEVHSVAPAPGAAPAAPAPAPAPAAAPAAKPALSLGAPTANPASPKAGAKMTVTVPAVDPDHKIDSITVLIPELNKLSIDLFDNATHGDATAHDGTWTADVELPATVAPGEYTLKALAFNANGEAILTAGKDGTAAQLSSSVKISVTK